MKNKFKRLFACFLAAVTVISSATALEIGVFAAEDGTAREYASPEETISSDGAVFPDSVEDTTTASVPTATDPVEETKPQESTNPSEPPKPTDPVFTEPSTKPDIKPVVNVGAVKNIQKTSAQTDKITVTWNKVSGATGYNLYLCKSDTSKTYKKIASVKGTKYTFTKLAQATPYSIRISAYVVKNGVTYEGNKSTKNTATQPKAVSSVKLKACATSIQITWSRNASATGYKIYRATGSSGGKYVEYKKITNNKTLTFTDKNVKAGKAYRYAVRAYKDLYKASTYHAEPTYLRTFCGLTAPKFKTSSQLYKVNISWSKNKYATGYNIYYATSKDGKYKKMGSTKGTSYYTPRLSNGKTYYFRVQPYRHDGAKKIYITGTYYTGAQKVNNKIYGKSIGNTYIEINIQRQHMWHYVDGKLYCETDVVTGNNDGVHNTPKGVYTIFQRTTSTNLVGADYVSYVNYWLGFTHSGIGIHDASWRSSKEYGGSTYKGNGSHGCVNTPYNAVKKIYGKAKIGTKVIVD